MVPAGPWMRTKLVLLGLPVTGFGEVRIADEGFDGAGVRVHFGIRAVDAAQEWPDGTVHRAAEIARCTDADVSGDVDRPTAGVVTLTVSTP